MPALPPTGGFALGAARRAQELPVVNSFLNISAYRFVAIDDPLALRPQLAARCAELGLVGTILLAGEGVNLFLAGPPAAVHGFLRQLQADARFAGMEAKESWSDTPPFRRLRVKVKREIIRMKHPAIQPAGGRAPAVGARTVKRWLDQGHDDQGRPVVTLDTRNAFEVAHGSFEGAIDWHLARFSDFPAALRTRKGELEGKTVVSFCTGGIRCEKAALLMREAGVESVWQLDGGILRYFEDAGGAHFRGNCFVFDEREALDHGLAPVPAT